MELGKVANMASEKQNATYIGQAEDKYSSMHSVVSRDSDSGEESSHAGRKNITFSKTKPGMLLRPAHVRKTLAKFEESKQSAVVQSGTRNVFLSEQSGSKPFDAEDSTIKGITDKFEKALSSEPPTDEANRRFPRSQTLVSY